MTISLFNKVKNKTESVDDLISFQQNLQTWISIDIIASLINMYNSYSSSKKFSFISSIIQVVSSVTYLIMVQYSTESYKNKQYDKALTFITIVLVLDIISCILAFIEFSIEIKENVTPVYNQYKKNKTVIKNKNKYVVKKK